jgi:hypothetical protein
MQQVSQLSNCALVTTVDKNHFQVAAFFVPVLLPNVQELSELLIHSPLPLAYPLGLWGTLETRFRGLDSGAVSSNLGGFRCFANNNKVTKAPALWSETASQPLTG